MDRRKVLMALAGAVSLAPAAAFAQAGVSVSAAPLTPTQFRLMALMGGDFAIATSRLALERSRSPSVRRFAELEINEQTAVAASLGATPGSAPLRADQAAMIQQLSALPVGPRFDRAYVQGQIMGHEELLGVHGGYLQARTGDSIGIAVANVAVPSIQTHLAVLSRLERGGGLST